MTLAFFFSVRKFISIWGVLLLLLLWIPFLRFFIMNMLVCFFEKVKINILFKFLDFHQYNSFVLQSMQNPHLWACFDISTKPNFGDDYAKCKPVVSLLLKITFLTLYFFLVQPALMLVLMLLLLHNLSSMARIRSLQCSLSSAVTHLQSLSTGLCPGNRQLTYFRRLSTRNLFALNSLSV